MPERPLHVWVVDDDQSVRWVLEKALRQADMETRSFERAEHLLDAIGEGQPDVLITDVRMPGMSGLALLERLRNSRPDLPIIVMSAQNTLMTALKATERGAFEYLPKPFDLNELVAVVGRAMAERFAEAHHLRLGDTLRVIIDGRRQTLRMVGTAIAPEFVYTLGPGMLEPTTMKSTPLERVFDPVDGRVTLTVSAEVDSRSRSLIRPSWTNAISTGCSSRPHRRAALDRAPSAPPGAVPGHRPGDPEQGLPGRAAEPHRDVVALPGAELHAGAQRGDD